MDIFSNLILQNPSGGSGGGGTWGSITGTLSDQTDLQNALNAKASLSGATFTGGIVSTLGSITTSTPMLSGTQTWNAVGTTFTGLKLNVADTASAAGSLLLDLQKGGTSQLVINKTGYIGIGTTTPSDQIHIPTGAIKIGNTRFLHDTSGGGLFIQATGTNVCYIGTGGLEIPASTSTVAFVNPGVSTYCKLKWNVGSSIFQLRNGSDSAYVDLGALSFTASGQSLTGSAATSLLDLSTTWNTTGTPTAIKLNVTNTASGASSNLLDLQRDGTSRFKVDKNGLVTATTPNSTDTAFFTNSIVFGFSGLQTWSQVWFGNGGAGDTKILADANRRLGISGNSGAGGALATDLYLYNSGYLGATNWERLSFTWQTTAGVCKIYTEKAGTGTARDLVLGTNATTAITISATDQSITTAAALSDSIGNVRSIPQNAQTSAYVLAATDNGKHVSITTGGVTVNSGIFSAGQVVVIYNNSSSNQTITQGTSVTMYQGGTTNTGNRTLASYGVATILCVASNTFVITGSGLT